MTQSYDKSPYTNKNKFKKSKVTTQNTTQRLRTVLGRSVEVTNAIQLVWWKRFAGTKPSHLPQKLCNQKGKTINNHPYII